MIQELRNNRILYTNVYQCIYAYGQGLLLQAHYGEDSFHAGFLAFSCSGTGFVQGQIVFAESKIAVVSADASSEPGCDNALVRVLRPY
jgi:hypothetical protein